MTKKAAFGVGKSQGQRMAQEDYITCTEDLLDKSGSRPILTVVADGLGGHIGGEIASKLAATEFMLSYQRETPGTDGILRDALIWANDQVADHINRDPSVDGMGCTLVALEIAADSSAYRWISVGDSLLLSITPDSVARLNADHSYREERRKLKEAGESLAGAPSGNALQSAVLGTHIPLIDDHSAWRAFAPGEILVIATDGLETLDLDEVAEIVRANPDAVKSADALIATVEAAGKPRQDNTTVAVIHGPLEGSPIAKKLAPPPIVPVAAAKKQTPPWLLLGVGSVVGILVGGSALLGFQALTSKVSDQGAGVHNTSVAPTPPSNVAVVPAASSTLTHDAIKPLPAAPKPVAKAAPPTADKDKKADPKCVKDQSVQGANSEDPQPKTETGSTTTDPKLQAMPTEPSDAPKPPELQASRKQEVVTSASAKNGKCPVGFHPAPKEQGNN